jgi:2'-5' RNA ligase
MAEKILVLMADWDDETQRVLSGWYVDLTAAGFEGKQTAGLPHHISLSTYTLDMEAEAVELMKKVADGFAPFEVQLSHIGLFAGGSVLFAGPERNPDLDRLHEACDLGVVQEHPWTPHTTILINEPDVVHRALPTVVRSFRPLTGTITRLHLCAFWPTREIAAFELNG